MEERKIVCSLITSLFSCGAYKNMPELRPSEVKGAMRYMYRISSPAELHTLVNDEAELFGGAAGSGEKTGHASPIRLLIRGDMKKDSKKLLLHEAKKLTLSCFYDGEFEVTAYFNPAVFSNRSGFWQAVDIDWYEDLIKLSLMICGMGKRCRKGRGSFQIKGMSFKTPEDFLEWLCKTLNRIGSASSKSNTGAFSINRGVITFKYNLYDYQRPVIHKIRIGEKMKKDQIAVYLGAVDEACHELKKGEIKCGDRVLDRRITGFAGAKGKLASPLLIRIVQLEDGFYPLYIFLKSVSGEKWFDRETFISYVEDLNHKGVRQ